MVRFARPGLIACFAVAMSLLPCTRIVLGQDDTTPSDDNQTASVNATASPNTWLQSPAIVGTAIANTFSPSPRIEVGPWDYPHGINPLTGLPYPNDEALKRRNLIVKVSNWPPRVRPQHAVNQADLVYEYEAEGGVTRFAAIYRNSAPEQVGSIRSARLLDIELLSMYAALLAYSGTSGPIHEIYKNASYRPVLLSPSLGDNCEQAGFCRDDSVIDRGYEHTLFGDTRQMWELATKRNLNFGYRANGFAFDLQANEGGSLAKETYINWYSRTDVRWQYDHASKRYLRYADEVPHRDAVDNSQLWADNLLMLQVAHNRRPDLFTPGSIDESYELALWGQGPAYVLREGILHEVLWWRRNQNRGEAIRLIFADGEPIMLKPGRTWITLLRTLDWVEISSELTDITASPTTSAPTQS